MAYTAKSDGTWVDKTATGGTATSNLIDAGDCNRWEANQLDAHTRLTAVEAPTANTQTGTAYTLVLADAGKVVERNNASANTTTIPTNASVAFPVGTVIEVFQYGAGASSVVAASGVTILPGPSPVAISARYQSLSLRKRATDEWIVA